MKPHDSVPYSLPDISDAESIERATAFRDRITQRRTCRYFTDEPVPREVIEAAITAAGSAPNGANHQPWHFAVVASPDKKKAIREAAEQEEREFYGAEDGQAKASDQWLDALSPLGTDQDKPFLETAPWLIVVFAQRKGGIEEDGKTQNYYVNESVGIACGMLIATLHEAGCATLTHTPSPMGFLRDICGRPPEEKPLMIVVVGKPAKDATVPTHALQKKPLGQISSWL
ncbi:nitroreductase family protein [Pontixanthobacter aestiaquae]|uniref:Nitroreductase family protein n=1 Tax=Pontixanthobacter aestiaquae TaxID=1509367 RepID=A0A844Z460_9SPHN|nr:nitroreductase family protein [Pontixanthobacter aestiaquae]MDN3645531.1 nitroreductase family protein [Pontixanthobacter aestiaquae]MXO83471.1 nitroreductase family protein [Pontixanthobacter aestiaquae]